MISNSWLQRFISKPSAFAEGCFLHGEIFTVDFYVGFLCLIKNHPVFNLNPTLYKPVYSQASTFSISGKNCLSVPSTHPLSVAG
jgi:hypothetical protein